MSVVIPAHDEELLVVPLLRALASDPDLEIVVVANGCTDGTAEAARAVSGRVRVIEIAEASKIAALNTGDAAASAWPRAFVDADVTVTPAALRAVASAMGSQGSLVGAPRLKVDVSRASWAVRAYYRIWELTDYRRDNHVGSGIYTISETGRARFDAFPDIIADDLFVLRLFERSERLGDIGASFTVEAPRTFAALLHRSERIALGNLQLGPAADASPSSGSRGLVERVAARPRLWVSFAVYCVGYAVPRMRARKRWRAGDLGVWNRDETTRTTA